MRVDHVVILAVGVILGVSLSDREGDAAAGIIASGINEAPRARLAGSVLSPEGAQLHAMRALLRGDSAASGRADAELPLPATPLAATALAPPSAIRGRSPVRPDTVAADDVLTRRAVDGAGHASPPAARTAAATPVAVGAPAAPVSVDPRTTAVRGVVRRFESAWTRMDAAATLAVWPSANPSVLTRAFSAMREQRLRLAPCRIEMSAAGAEAACNGTLRYRPRLGEHSTRVRRDRWAFELDRTAAGWVITNVRTPS